MVQSSDIRQAFVARLKQASASAGIPDWGLGARLAEIAKVTPKAASKWLNMESMPGRSNMQAMAEAFGVRVEWLEYGDGEMKSAEKLPATSSADIVRKMLEKHGKGLTDDARKKIVDAVEAEASPLPSLVDDDLAVIRVRPGELSIPQYDVRGSMGHGQLPDEYVRHIRNVIVSEELIHDLGLQYTAPRNLCFMTGSGQSMEGTINDKSPLLVDRGIQSFVGDGVYAFTWNDLFQVKRLQMIDAERVAIISDNPSYQPVPARIDDLYVHARVLVAWNAKKL